MKHPLARKALSRSVLAFSLLFIQSCSWFSNQPSATQDIQSLDYHLRWDHAEFSAQYAWINLLMPPAHAELPPQYQEAFSLYIVWDHSKQELALEYHKQMVMDPETHVHFKQKLGAQAYAELTKLLSRDPLICKYKVEPGMAGPAPRILNLKYTDKVRYVYPSGSSGYDGPGNNDGIRYALCQNDLETYLQKLIRTGLANNSKTPS